MNAKKILLLSFVSLQLFSFIQAMDTTSRELRKRKKEDAREEVDRQVIAGRNAAKSPFYCDPCNLIPAAIIGTIAFVSYYNHHHIRRFFSGSDDTYS